MKPIKTDDMKAVTATNGLNANQHLTFTETRQSTADILSCTSDFGKRTKRTWKVTMTWHVDDVMTMRCG